MRRHTALTFGDVRVRPYRVVLETDLGSAQLSPQSARLLALKLLEASHAAERPALWEVVREAGARAFAPDPPVTP